MVDLTKIYVGGKSASVNSAYAGNFQGFVNDLSATGYKIKSIGGYNYRNIAGTNRLSKHATGKAIDINPEQNPVTFGGASAVQSDLPSGVSDMAARYGLKWGGDFKGSKRDPMHFEVTGATVPMSGTDTTNGNPQEVDAGAAIVSDPMAADYSGDGIITHAEQEAYDANTMGAKVIAGTKAAGPGSADNVAVAIVTAGNQNALTQAAALKAIAAGAAAASQASDATNVGIVSQFTSWLGGRVLQIMVFVVAVVFLLVGLYMFAPKETLVMPDMPT